MFVGGTLLTSTIGYAWLKPRMERTVELQQCIHRVKQNMYWSMSFTQRTNLVAEESLYKQHKQQGNQRHRKRLVEKTNIWWNSKLADFAVWAVEPGYASSQAGLALAAVKHNITHMWTTAKRSVAASSTKAVQNAKGAVRWNDAMELIQNAWYKEKSKWTLAHMKAIEAVHPLYEQEHEQQQQQQQFISGKTISYQS
ncbi:hypothetical protein IW140_006338 [Coemansia sp. RSA 1813]|nr:hypothetical protein EV178_006314 [Coemansia sp. RSA 1646]KAJ2210384.1 hypothetical protein EV179_006281 [Coemansia sp. RSA 487]KAJ2562741.1 hypothetical protein IW140_006338 [Coemansia sp. RSA 1813]